MRLLSCALASAVLVVGCDTYTPPATPSAAVDPSRSTTPTHISLTAGTRTDQQLDVTAEVLSADGHGVPNIPVQFSIATGTVTPALVTTDTAGKARTIAAASGQTTVSATIGGGIVSAASVIGGVTPLSVTLAVPSAIVNAASTLTASVSGQPLGGPFTYAWTFGDGKNDSGSVNGITHVYPGIGSYAAVVKVTDGSGRSATSSATAAVTDVPVVVTPAPTPTPAPTLAVVLSCSAGTTAHQEACNVSASYGTTQLAASAISVAWDWGDGHVNATATPPIGTNTYAQPGTYIVIATITATTSDGAKTTTATKSITVT